MSNTEEEQPREERCSCGGMWVNLTYEGFDPLLLWWLALYIEVVVLFQILSGKEVNNGHFESGQLVQAILTKGGLRLQMALVVTPPWAPW